MLRILPLADDLILPQARQEIYFFNRIDPMQTFMDYKYFNNDYQFLVFTPAS
jgi:hypothetical protein